MNIKKLNLSILIILISLMSLAARAEGSQNRSLYLGFIGGYGLTSWQYLVPKDMNDALSTSIPIKVNEGGAVWGLYLGYLLIPNFALELSYLRYPLATLFFDNLSLFSFEHNGRTSLTTRTSRMALAGKFLVPIPYTKLKAYSSFGGAEIHREDAIVDRSRFSAIFGAGLTYDISEHVMTELGGEYVAGYGQSELDPAEHYIPFLYSIFLKIAYKLY